MRPSIDYVIHIGIILKTIAVVSRRIDSYCEMQTRGSYSRIDTERIAGRKRIWARGEHAPEKHESTYVTRCNSRQMHKRARFLYISYFVSFFTTFYTREREHAFYIFFATFVSFPLSVFFFLFLLRCIYRIAYRETERATCSFAPFILRWRRRRRIPLLLHFPPFPLAARTPTSSLLA